MYVTQCELNLRNKQTNSTLKQAMQLKFLENVTTEWGTAYCTATMVLQQFYYNNCTAKMALQQLQFNNITATITMQQLHWLVMTLMRGIRKVMIDRYEAPGG